MTSRIDPKCIFRHNKNEQPLWIQNDKLTETDRVENRGKLKQTTRQASAIYLYIK